MFWVIVRIDRLTGRQRQYKDRTLYNAVIETKP